MNLKPLGFEAIVHTIKNIHATDSTAQSTHGLRIIVQFSSVASTRYE